VILFSSIGKRGFVSTKISEGGFCMTKAELVAAMAKEAGVSKAVAGKTLEVFMNTVADELKKNNKIGLVGFGTFSVVKRKARTGRNPRTGQEIKIKAKKAIKFKPGKNLAAKI